MASLSAAEDKGKFMADTEKKLGQVDGQITTLAQKAADLKADAKTQADNLMQGVREKRDAAEQKLKDLKAAGQEKWADLKAGVAAAIDDLQKQLDKAKESIK